MYNNMQGQGWGQPQQQSGFQQPQMTGYPQQQQPQQTGFIQPQATGYPAMSQFQRPMATGYPQQQPQQQQQQPQQQQQQPQQQQQQNLSFLSAQPTGMMAMGGGGGLSPGLGQMRMGMGTQQQQRFLSPGPGGMGSGLQLQPTGFMGGGLQPQPTGYMSGGVLSMQPTGLMPQMTGMPIRDPRLQLMSTQFLPASQPFSGAPVASNMNFSQTSMQPSNFQSQIQNLSQQQQDFKQPTVPWALSKEEKKSYDSIFRAWDSNGSGFISGDVAREVFGQSGLEREKLMQIWHLSDTENRGKLNINEFHVAMGLIYRCLNGNDCPETLPVELVPPSARDLNDSVDFLKDLLKKNTSVRNSTGLNIPEAGSNSGANYTKSRSFHENPVAPKKKDATAYKHEDSQSAGYKSSSRHLDRKAVRYEGQSATDDLSEMKRQLENTQKMLNSQNEKDEDDRELEREMDDLRYRIRRVQDDIEYYNRRGGRDSADLRRKAERELMHLMHERLPQLEKRIEAKDRKDRDRKLGESRERDDRNDPYRKYGSYDRDDRDSVRGSSRYDGVGRGETGLGDGEYLRGTFDRGERDDDRRRGDYSRDRSRDRYNSRDDKSDYSSSRRDDRDGGRGSAPPPPPAPVAEVSKPAPPASAPPVSAASPAPSTPSAGLPKNMSAEERAAWIRSEAQRRVQERMRMLGAVAPAGPAAVDTSVEERLKTEKAEAEARSAQADKEAAAREEARKARLEEHKLQSEKAALQTVKAEIQESKKGPNAPPAPVVQAAEEIKDQEDMIRRREEVLAKEKAEREARLRRLEEQEEEAKRQEEAFKEKQSMFANKSKASAPVPPTLRKAKGGAPPPPPPSRKSGAPALAAAAPPAPPAPPATPPAPAAPPAPTQAQSSPTNPFHRMQQGDAPAAASPAMPGTNPFFRQQQEAAAGLAQASRATPPISAQPTGNASASTRSIHVAPKHDDDDWEDSDKEDEDADGPGSSTRATRQNLAQALFSNLVPGGRSTPPSASTPAAPATLDAPPAAPSAPVFKPPTTGAPVERGALLGEIQGGLKLKKAKTNDRSVVAVAGAVIGDATPPVQKFIPPPSPPTPAPAAEPETIPEAPPAPPAAPPAPPADPSATIPGGFFDGFGMDDFSTSSITNPNRQSVDWANSLAADQMNGKQQPFVPDEPSVREEEEDSGDEGEGPEALDAGRDILSVHAQGDDLDQFDLSSTIRARALYAYSSDQVSFEENDILSTHPTKDESGDWWYATGSHKGYIPRSYIEPITKTTQAKALYDYTGASSEEATFSEGDTLTIVDQSDSNWWRVDVGGNKVLIAPATYLEDDTVMVQVPSSNECVHVSDDEEMQRALKASEEANKKKEEARQIREEEEDLKLALSLSAKANLPAGGEDEDEDLRVAMRLSQQEIGGSETEDSVTGWTSSEDEEDLAPQTDAEIRKQAAERIRVLEAAGILVSAPVEERRRAPPPPKLMGIARKAKPERPERKVKKPERQLPPVPRTEDAYDRYLKITQEVSMEPAPNWPPPSTRPSSAGLLNTIKQYSRSRPERRATPTISGPITRPASGSSGSTTASWSFLVGPSASTLPEPERKRQEAIFELISTETTHVRDLQIIIQLFFSSLSPLLSPKASTVIFANVEAILLVAVGFLSDLEERQRESRLYVESVGDVVEKWMREMGVYLLYCVNQRAAGEVLEGERQREEVQDTLKGLRGSKAARGLDLSHFLLGPMQRITRYPLLISQVIRYTPEDHPDLTSLKRAHTFSRSLLEKTNTAIARAELDRVSQHLYIGSSRLDLTTDDRRIIKDATVSKSKSGRKLRVLLCNDLLVLMHAEEARGLYRMPIPLQEVAASHKGGESWSVKVQGEREVKLKARDAGDWVNEINKAKLY